MARCLIASASTARYRATGYVAFECYGRNLVPGDTNNCGDVFVRDRIEIEFDGIARDASRVGFTVSQAVGESGHLAPVLLSCSGTDGFPLGNGRVVPLTFDACTVAGIDVITHVSAPIDVDGVARTPPIKFRSVAPQQTIYAAAVTLDAVGTVIFITAPIAFAVH